MNDIETKTPKQLFTYKGDPGKHTYPVGSILRGETDSMPDGYHEMNLNLFKNMVVQVLQIEAGPVLINKLRREFQYASGTPGEEAGKDRVRFGSYFLLTRHDMPPNAYVLQWIEDTFSGVKIDPPPTAAEVAAKRKAEIEELKALKQRLTAQLKAKNRADFIRQLQRARARERPQ